MRCDACNTLLTAREDSRRSATTGERIGLCDPCFTPISTEFHKIVEDPLADDTPSPIHEGNLTENNTNNDDTTGNAYFNEEASNTKEAKDKPNFKTLFEDEASEESYAGSV